MVATTAAPAAVESLRAIEQTIERLLFNSNKLHAVGKQTQQAICQRAEDGRRGRAQFFSFSRETRSCQSCTQPSSTYSLSRGTTVAATDKPECITSSNFRTDCSASTVPNQRNETSTSGVSTDPNRASEATSTQTTSTNLLEEPPGCRQKTQICETEVRKEERSTTSRETTEDPKDGKKKPEAVCDKNKNTKTDICDKEQKPPSPDPLATPLSNKKNSATQTSLSRTCEQTRSTMTKDKSIANESTSGETATNGGGKGDGKTEEGRKPCGNNIEQGASDGARQEHDSKKEKRIIRDFDEQQRQMAWMREELEKARDKREAEERRKIHKQLQEESMLLVSRVQQKINELEAKEKQHLNENWSAQERAQMEELEKEILKKEEMLKRIEKERRTKEKELKDKMEEKKTEEWNQIKEKLENERCKMLDKVKQQLNKEEADMLTALRNRLNVEKEQKEFELSKQMRINQECGNTPSLGTQTLVEPNAGKEKNKRRGSVLMKKDENGTFELVSQSEKSSSSYPPIKDQTHDSRLDVLPSQMSTNSNREFENKKSKKSVTLKNSESSVAEPKKSRSHTSIRKTASKSEVVHKQNYNVAVNSADGKTEQLPGKLTVERVPSSNFLTCRFVVKDKHGVVVELEAEIHGTVTKNIRINGKAVG